MAPTLTPDDLAAIAERVTMIVANGPMHGIQRELALTRLAVEEMDKKLDAACKLGHDNEMALAKMEQPFAGVCKQSQDNADAIHDMQVSNSWMRPLAVLGQVVGTTLGVIFGSNGQTGS